ncbi:MAG: MlaD family protein [Paracoccaceae bacterium]
MTDAPQQAPATMRVEEGRRRPSLVWLVPILAVAAALFVTWSNYREQGPLVTVTFESATGMVAGQTALRYRDVQVGLVEDVRFTDDLSRVAVDIRVDADVAPYLDEGAQFYVVAAEISARGISGLGTVLSGVYIEGEWDREAGGLAGPFEGLETAPLQPASVQGTAITLVTREGSQLQEGAPILFQGIEVGTIGAPQLSTRGSVITIPAFVRAPHDRRLSDATRFWDASGFSLSFGAGGVSLDVDSLAALVGGAVSFDTFLSGGNPISAGHRYDIFGSQDEARNSVFDSAAERAITVAVIFDRALAGLRAGAFVRYNGVRVGTVTDLTGYIDPDDRTRDVQLLATLELLPAKMGLRDSQDTAETVAFLDQLVRSGMRARLASDSLFGGDLLVDLVDLPEAALTDAGLGRDPDDVPLIPSVPASASDFTATAEGVFERVNALPVEELLASAITVLDNVGRLTGSGDAQAIPGAALGVLDGAGAVLDGAGGLVGDARGLVGPEGGLGDAVADINAAAADLRALTAALAEGDAAANLTATLAAAQVLASDLSAAAAGVPEATAAFAALGTSLAALPLDDLIARAEGTLAAIEAVAANPDTARLPTEAAALASDLRTALAEVRQDDALTALSAALARTDAITADIAAASATLPSAVARLDALGAELTALASSANDLDLAGTVAGAQAALAAIEGVASDPSVTALPAEAAALASDLRGALAEIRQGEALTALSAALARTDAIAAGIEAGTEGLPELTARLSSLSAQAEALVASADALPLDALVRRTTDLASAATAFLSSDEAGDVPAVLADALEELRDTLAAFREGGAVGNLNDALAAAAGAASSVAATSDALREGDAVDNLNAALASARAAAAGVDAAVAEFRASGAVTNLGSTLASTDEAAQAIAAAVATLPALIATLDGAAGDIGTLAASYDDRSRFGQDSRRAVASITAASDAVTSLARAIERNPQAFILGR